MAELELGENLMVGVLGLLALLALVAVLGASVLIVDRCTRAHLDDARAGSTE